MIYHYTTILSPCSCKEIAPPKAPHKQSSFPMFLKSSWGTSNLFARGNKLRSPDLRIPGRWFREQGGTIEEKKICQHPVFQDSQHETPSVFGNPHITVARNFSATFPEHTPNSHLGRMSSTSKDVAWSYVRSFRTTVPTFYAGRVPLQYMPLHRPLVHSLLDVHELHMNMPTLMGATSSVYLRMCLRHFREPQTHRLLMYVNSGGSSLALLLPL